MTKKGDPRFFTIGLNLLSISILALKEDHKMNEERRKSISEAISHIEEARAILETCATEEKESFDSLPSEKQESDAGQTIEAAASTLEESLDKCDSLISDLNDAKV